MYNTIPGCNCCKQSTNGSPVGRESTTETLGQSQTRLVVDLSPRWTILEDDETKLVAQQLIRICLGAAGRRKTLLLGHGSSS
uniref:Uncharacterized protein n=1 Tax=Oryza rufipogon TaxID=4529 RepID=A0A0E0Q721_ORYRU